ncbi:MAG: hypothetical protein ACAI35_20650 [Candidatus Methylacidiphilales bacterium]|nr:hypothetical protein [Candidatus Methylacidiphilales bacterium]
MNKTFKAAVCGSLSTLLAAALPALLVAAILPATLHAQSASPSQPYVKTPPSGTSWTIDIRQVPRKAKPSATANGQTDPATAGNAEKAPATLPAVMPVRMESQYGQNKVRRELTIFSDSHREESFTIKGQLLRRYDGSDKVAVLQATPVFPALEWLASGSVYMGKEMLGDKECHKFRISAEYLQSLNWPAETPYFAWISVADRYPVQVQADESMYTYSDIVPFTKNVPLPEDYKAAVEQASRSQRALEMMRAQNGR